MTYFYLYIFILFCFIFFVPYYNYNTYENFVVTNVTRNSVDLLGLGNFTILGLQENLNRIFRFPRESIKNKAFVQTRWTAYFSLYNLVED